MEPVCQTCNLTGFALSKLWTFTTKGFEPTVLLILHLINIYLGLKSIVLTMHSFQELHNLFSEQCIILVNVCTLSRLNKLNKLNTFVRM